MQYRMIDSSKTDESLNEYVERYTQFGINITSHKTKLAKKIYLIILLINLELVANIFLLFKLEGFA